MSTWSWSYAIECVPPLMEGLVWNIVATLGGIAGALAIGLPWNAACRSRHWWLGYPARWLLQLIRSTPLLIQLYIVFYLTPSLGLRLPPLLAGIITLAVHYGTYAAEIYRAGIEAVDRGQSDAATALGMTAWQRFRLVIIPQAIPPSIPALGNLLVAMLKDAPLLSAITVMEMLYMAKDIGSRTFDYLEPMTLVGVLFLIVSLLAAIPIRWLERRVGVRA
jgi:polar amino acid transport system permease protein